MTRPRSFALFLKLREYIARMKAGATALMVRSAESTYRWVQLEMEAVAAAVLHFSPISSSTASFPRSGTIDIPLCAVAAVLPDPDLAAGDVMEGFRALDLRVAVGTTTESLRMAFPADSFGVWYHGLAFLARDKQWQWSLCDAIGQSAAGSLSPPSETSLSPPSAEPSSAKEDERRTPSANDEEEEEKGLAAEMKKLEERCAAQFELIDTLIRENRELRDYAMTQSQSVSEKCSDEEVSSVASSTGSVEDSAAHAFRSPSAAHSTRESQAHVLERKVYQLRNRLQQQRRFTESLLALLQMRSSGSSATA